MKRLFFILLCTGALASYLFVDRAFQVPLISHQLPYDWDAFVRPDLEFEMEPMSNVIRAVNTTIRDVSNGTIPEAIKLDTTPTQINKINSNAVIDGYMNQLISTFRDNEKEMFDKGALGFESTPYTGRISGSHSLYCSLMMGEGGLIWEPKDDALHVSRSPSYMECRPYYLADELFTRMKKQRSEGHYKVGAEPIVSTLINETDMHSWSILLPQGPNSWFGESRFEKVFKYIPELKIILALATPEEHSKAESQLKKAGLWIEPTHQ